MTSPESELFAAVELGGSKALCAVGTWRQSIAEARIATSSPDATLCAIEAFFRPHRGRLRALGIASFGPLELDPRAPNFGALLSSPKLAWSGAPIAGRLGGALGVPVAVDTDVNAAAIAEQRCGAGKGADPCAYVTVGSGIGVGVCIGSAPLHGLLHPELGHLPALPLCDFAGVCPFHGRCLEGVASARALAARTGKAPELLADDDPVWALEARYLAQLLSACVLAYAPRAIVLGGGVLQRNGLRERVRAELSASLASYVPRRELSAEGVRNYVRAPHFGERAGLTGAFLLAEARSSSCEPPAVS